MFVVIVVAAVARGGRSLTVQVMTPHDNHITKVPRRLTELNVLGNQDWTFRCCNHPRRFKNTVSASPTTIGADSCEQVKAG